MINTCVEICHGFFTYEREFKCHSSLPEVMATSLVINRWLTIGTTRAATAGALLVVFVIVCPKV